MARRPLGQTPIIIKLYPSASTQRWIFALSPFHCCAVAQLLTMSNYRGQRTVHTGLPAYLCVCCRKRIFPSVRARGHYFLASPDLCGQSPKFICNFTARLWCVLINHDSLAPHARRIMRIVLLSIIHTGDWMLDCAKLIIIIPHGCGRSGGKRFACSLCCAVCETQTNIGSRV